MLAQALADARTAADDPAAASLPAPRPYPELGMLNYRWIKRHRYGFGYRIAEDRVGVIGHIWFEEADIPRHTPPRRPERN